MSPGAAFTGVLIKNGIAVSMDGKKAWRDNVFVERLWRSVKYEEVYLRAHEGVSDARASIGRYLDFYNGRRPQRLLHAAASPLGSLTPAELHISKRKNCSDNRVQLYKSLPASWSFY